MRFLLVIPFIISLAATIPTQSPSRAHLSISAAADKKIDNHFHRIVSSNDGRALVRLFKATDALMKDAENSLQIPRPTKQQLKDSEDVLCLLNQIHEVAQHKLQIKIHEVTGIISDYKAARKLDTEVNKWLSNHAAIKKLNGQAQSLRDVDAKIVDDHEVMRYKDFEDDTDSYRTISATYQEITDNEQETEERERNMRNYWFELPREGLKVSSATLKLALQPLKPGDSIYYKPFHGDLVRLQYCYLEIFDCEKASPTAELAVRHIIQYLIFASMKEAQCRAPTYASVVTTYDKFPMSAGKIRKQFSAKEYTWGVFRMVKALYPLIVQCTNEHASILYTELITQWELLLRIVSSHPSGKFISEYSEEKVT